MAIKSTIRSILVPTKIISPLGQFSFTSLYHLLMALVNDFFSTIEKHIKNTSVLG